MTNHQLTEIRAAQKEHVAGMITFAEFMQIVSDLKGEG